MKKSIVAIILTIVFAIGLSACAQHEEQPLCEEDIRAICELATLECYYNTVAKIEKEADNIFQKDRKMWIEYEGKAKIGINMAYVVIDIKEDLVSIAIPKAEILSTDYTFFEDSYICSADGWLIKNEITTEEQQNAVIESQEQMKQDILQNEALFMKAEARAKELIESYITNVGKVVGKEYRIEWKN